MAPNRLSSAFQSFLHGLDGETADQVITTLQNAVKRSKPTSSADMAVIESGVSKIVKKRRTTAKHPISSAKPKRPLNSWMAFRKFYSSSLSPHTQKSISKILTTWWHNDLFEAKWTILAKAYSILRGNREKNEVLLDEFFDICAPLISVIPPERYQQMMGWCVVPIKLGDRNEPPEVIRTFVPRLEDLPDSFTTTTLGVDDLVSHCRSLGYGGTQFPGTAPPASQVSLTMASKPFTFATEPAPPFHTPSEFTSDEGTPGEALEVGGQSEQFSSDINDVTSPPLAMAEPAGKALLQAAEDEMMRSGLDYPYYELFDPESTNGFVFDPAAVDPALHDGGIWNAYDFVDLNGSV